jgi:AcrR family transcriptional regulator
MRPKLSQIRKEKAQEDSVLRRRVMEAMLCACGDLGYRNVSVQDVIDRYGGHRVQFYELFESKADCYAAAYETHAECLCERLLGVAGAEPHWREGLDAALAELARLAAARPLLARGMVAEVHVAGEPALSQREEMIKRLSRAIDSARRETGSRHSPPPETAAFMVGAIESAVASALTKGTETGLAEEAMSDLAWIVSAAYF